LSGRPRPRLADLTVELSARDRKQLFDRLHHLVHAPVGIPVRDDDLRLEIVVQPRWKHLSRTLLLLLKVLDHVDRVRALGHRHRALVASRVLDRSVPLHRGSRGEA
jgi:hypothetical protein